MTGRDLGIFASRGAGVDRGFDRGVPMIVREETTPVIGPDEPVVALMRSQRVYPTLRSMFVELDTRENDGLSVSLEWDRETGVTQIVLEDAREASVITFEVPAADASEAFRHPYTFIPRCLFR